ncbi:MAG: transposase [Planctomycetaceae bacterium]
MLSRTRCVVSDMWHNYMDIMRIHLPGVTLCLDWFHVINNVNNATDAVPRLKQTASLQIQTRFHSRLQMTSQRQSSYACGNCFARLL